MSAATEPIVRADRVSKRFGALTAVDGVNFAVRRNEVTGIFGSNGAGKTTFFNALSGVVAPTSGDLLVEGVNMTGTRPDRFARRGVARTFQTPRVFADLSVVDNVDFGLQFAGRRRAAPRQLHDAANILGVIGLAGQAALPAAAITPSQQRLLEIGMALATRPKVLLLDEVAAGLTESEVEATARLIRGLRDEFDLTVIWIEHAVTTLMRYVERVLVLHQGRRIADAPPQQVVRSPEVIEAYLGDEMAGAAP